jgi:uncharacterized membrane protein
MDRSWASHHGVMTTSSAAPEPRRRTPSDRAGTADRVHAGGIDGERVAAWRRVTAGEKRLPGALATAMAIGLQLALPDRLNLASRFLLPAVEAVMLLVLVLLNPDRVDKTSRPLRLLALGLTAVASLANAYSATQLVRGLVNGTLGGAAGPLLSTGAAIYLTNIIIFALWYWELDRGGPAARAAAVHIHPDFLFPQMTAPDIGDPEWEPGFADYLYVSFTNATAFSPTDTLPLTRWAKMIMLLQSAVSLVTVALVIARAVNILK